MKGAGGTDGGILGFILGLAMFAVGIYLFLSNIVVTNTFGMRTALFGFGGSGGMKIVTGYILIPFVIGVLLLFYNYRSILGWILSAGSIILLMFGVITSFQFRWRSLSLFDTLIIIVLIFGGIGLFLKSLRGSRSII